MADEQNGNGRLFKITTEKVLTIIVAVLIAWGAVQGKIAVLETKQGDSERRLERIEMKLDELISRP